MACTGAAPSFQLRLCCEDGNTMRVRTHVTQRRMVLMFAARLQIVNETIPALVALKTAGLVRHIGITGLPLKLYPAVLSRLPPGSLDVCLSYCHYCLNDRSLVGILPQLEKHSVGVINASCLSMGLLTASGPPDWHPAPQELKDAAARAAQVASGKGLDISELALMWAVQVREDPPSPLSPSKYMPSSSTAVGTF